MIEIKEQIEVNKFNSKRLGLYLLSRDAPTPEEKEIIEDLPYSQGVLDFSMIMGERMFKNRPLTYEFIAIEKSYEARKPLERQIKRDLMMNGIVPIYDTHNLGYFWLGKCVSVEVEDDHETGRLRVTIEFDVYPFLYTVKKWFDDAWDSFNFDNDVANYTKYQVNGERTIELVNNGDVTVTPVVVVQGGVFQPPENPGPDDPETPIEPEPDPTPENPELPVESKFDGARVVNLADYGGSSSNADNFTALKSAVNASATEPLIIEVDAGIYNLQGTTNDRIQMEPWESAKSKGVRLVGKGDVTFKHKHNRTVNKHEYYFMQLVMSEDSLGFEMENITVDGIRNPQEELFYTQTESNPVPNIPLTRGIATTGAHNVQYKNVTFKNMYGGYAIQMSEYRDVSIKDVNFDKVGGNDIQESFGMAIYLGGHSGNAIVNIDNVQAQGMVTDKELKLSWIGVVLENGSIQSNNPDAWMRDKNTTVNIANSSFMDYQSTFHVESMAGNVYWNVDGLTARGSNYQIVAGVYGEYKESSNNVKMDMMPYGRLWGIVHGLWYTEAQETEDNISGHNRMDMYNSIINLKTIDGFNNIPQAISYGNSVKGYLHNTQLNDVPYKLVQNGSAYLYDSVVNLAQGSSETRASLQTGMFGTSEQEVAFDNTLVNTYANRTNVSFGDKPEFVKNTGFVAPHINLPINPPI